jgi:multicomponent Na+:H+ antiporter subunit D
MMLAIMILVAAGLSLGLLPQAPAAFEAAAQQFNDRAGYLAQALGHAAAAAHPVPAGGWTASAVVIGLLSVALAIMVAGLGLYSGRLPATVRSAFSPARPVLTGLHRLHSGHIGDYVAWLFAGITAVAALIGLPLL